MSSRNDMDRRVEELLIDQAVFGLDAAAEAELTALLEGRPVPEENPFMETAALVQLGLAAMEREKEPGESMPDSLRRKLELSAGRR